MPNTGSHIRVWCKLDSQGVLEVSRVGTGRRQDVGEDSPQQVSITLGLRLKCWLGLRESSSDTHNCLHRNVLRAGIKSTDYVDLSSGSTTY